VAAAARWEGGFEKERERERERRWMSACGVSG
jgi:hypothetical protein